MFDDCDFVEPAQERPRQPDEDDDHYESVPWEMDAILDHEWHFSLLDRLGPVDGPMILAEPEPYSHRTEHEPKIDPDCPHYPINLRSDHAEKGLQVIVQLINIHLTPCKPRFDGQPWRVAGAWNEHICASAIYYYDSDNITTTSLTFREPVDYHEFLEHESAHASPAWLRRSWPLTQAVFGFEEGAAAVQEIGSVHARKGRLVAFPNVLQSRMEPFELADATRPGHQKLLMLHLVDPYRRIASTAHVPPQQKSWWRRAVQTMPPITSRLPPELVELIIESGSESHLADGSGLMDLTEAKEVRLAMIEELEAAYETAWDELENECAFGTHARE
jgi:hypothetical protein